MTIKIVWASPEHVAKAMDLYSALVLKVAAVQDANGVTVHEVLNCAIHAYQHVLNETGHEDIAAAVRRMFNEKFVWPEVRNGDNDAVAAVGGAMWGALGMLEWEAMDYNSQAFGERAFVILYAVGLYIITGVSQIAGPQAADFVIEKLTLAGNWSIAKVVEGLPGTEAVN